MSSNNYDVAIVGGGPSGSTASTLLKKYAPGKEVLLIERERFPRDHVGESLLPLINSVLDEMGCWQEIERADFPVKIGATYRWGSKAGLWDFDFLPGEAYEDLPRPGSFEGQRCRTAFQVDRSIYDQILLEHAKSKGVEVREETKVVDVLHSDGRINGLRLGDSSVVTARYYIDASGHSGLFRRSLGIKTIEPSAIRNIAVWDYWGNADWAVNIGASGTRIQVMSLGWGWIWFIPITSVRTSIGLVMPAEYYKKSGKRPEELYTEALANEPRISLLLESATRENKVSITKDWSFLSEKMVGENWFLVGEAAGFADPILSAGVTLAHISSKEAAYTINELDRGDLNPEWLREQFASRQAKRIGHHIRFADYWYTSNSQFTDLIEFTSEIAKDAGLSLAGESAWQWLGTGGFVDDFVMGSGLAGVSLLSLKRLVDMFSSSDLGWHLARNNVFVLDLEGAKETMISYFSEGRIYQVPAYTRDNKVLPCAQAFGFLIQTLKRAERIDAIVNAIRDEWATQDAFQTPVELISIALQTLEGMVEDGWVKAMQMSNVPMLKMDRFLAGKAFQDNTDNKIKLPQ